MPVVMEPPEAPPSGMSFGARLAGDRYGSDEPFVVLVGEQVPPEGIQATTGLWGLVTLGGEPAAFISPDVVTALDPDEHVESVLRDLASAYVADLAAQPRDFFRANLGREVRGRVIILDRQCVPQRAGAGTRLDEFDDPPCDEGTILPVGETCEGCQCPRRRRR